MKVISQFGFPNIIFVVSVPSHCLLFTQNSDLDLTPILVFCTYVKNCYDKPFLKFNPGVTEMVCQGLIK